MKSQKQRVMMISTHGYVSAQPELGMPDTGGQVLYVLELSRSLARLGYAVDILTRQFEDQPTREEVDEGVQLLRFPCGGKEFIPKEHMHEVIPEWVERVKEYVAANDLSYAFIDSHYWDAGIAGQALADALGTRHIHTPHSIGAWKRDSMDGDPEEMEREYNFSKRIAEERRIYHACDVLLATTPQQREIVTNGDYEMPPQKIAVIPPGYDDTRFFPIAEASRDALRDQYGLDGRIVLALGRMARNKGYDLLVRAMPVVFDRVDDVKLLLAAGSTHPSEEEREQVDELRAIVDELGIADRVIIRHFIPDEELADHYRMADVFALSSRYEPFGMTAVEAMACGTPTVVTTEGGLCKEIVWGLEALYADPFDVDAFGHAICTILQYDEIHGQLARFGSEKARGHFTWNSIAQRLVQVLDGITAGEPASEPAPAAGSAPLIEAAPDLGASQQQTTAYEHVPPILECVKESSSSVM